MFFFKNLMREAGRTVAVLAVISGIAVVAFAYSEPSSAPTGGTVYPPINTSATAQTKSGSFTSSGTVMGNTVNATARLCLTGSCISAWASNLVTSINGAVGAITFTGPGVSQSGNTFTFSGGGGSSQWATSGSNIYNTNGGNVGIGTTNPDAKLRVSGGGIRLDNGQTISTPGRLHIQAENENLYLNPWSGTTYVGYGGGPGNLFVSGNVGIGTASPSEKLHVNGSVYVGGNWYKSGNITAVNNAISAWGAEGGVIAGFSNGRTVAIGQSLGIPGIGMTQGSTLLGAFYAGNTEIGLGVFQFGPAILRLWAENPAGFAASDILIGKDSTVRFRTQQQDRLFINSSGSVGIGTANPQETLHVNGDIFIGGNWYKGGDLGVVNSAINLWSAQGGVIAGFSDGTSVGIGKAVNPQGTYTGFGVAGGGSARIGVYYDPSRNFGIVDTWGGTPLVVKPYGGNVAIGGAFSPSQKLEVAGNIKAGRFYIGDNQYGTYSPGVGTDGWNVGVTTSGLFAVVNTWGGYQPVYASDYYITNIGKWASQLGGGGGGVTPNLDQVLAAGNSSGRSISVGAATIGGDLNFNGTQIRSPGRMHIAGGEILFLLNTNGVVVSKAWGGNGNLIVEGTATVYGSKNFEIPHPLNPENMRLVHSATEGPEIAVFYRGDGQLKNGRLEIILPAYFEALTRKEGRTILLTNIDGGDVLWVETQDGAQVKDGKFAVRSSNGNSSQKFNWEVKAVRADIEPLKVEVLKESK